MVQAGAGEGPVHEPHAGEPARRPEPGDPRGRGHLHPRGQGDRRGRGRARRQDGRDRLRVLELQLRLVPRLDADQEGRIRDLLLRAVGPPEHPADLPALVRVRGRDRRQPVRLPALQPLRRERRRARLRGRADPVGELPDQRQPGDRLHVPPDRLHLACADAGLHPAGGEARLPRRHVHQGGRGDRDGRVPRHPGLDRRDPRVAAHVLGADRRDVPQPRPVGERLGAAERRGGIRLPDPLQPGLPGDQGDHREPDRRRADRAPVEPRLEVARSCARCSTSSTAARTTTTPSTRSSSSTCSGTRSAASSAAATSCTSGRTPAATS